MDIGARDFQPLAGELGLLRWFLVYWNMEKTALKGYQVLYNYKSASDEHSFGPLLPMS